MSDAGQGADLRRALLAYALPVLVVGAIARFWELGRRSLWYDELYSVVSAATSTTPGALLQNWGILEAQPPGYQIFLFAWFRVFPATEFWARLPNAAAGAAAVCYLLFAKRLRLLPQERLYVAVFYATGSASLYYAQTCRQYGFLVPGILMSLLELLHVDRHAPRSTSSWMRLSGWLLLISYVHLFGLLVWVAVMTTATVRDYRERARVWAPIVGTAAFILLYIPGWFSLYQTWSLHLDEWQEPAALRSFVPDFLRYVFYDPPALALALVAVTVGAPLVWHRNHIAQVLNRWVSSQAFRPIAAVLALLLVEFALLSLFRPVLQHRYALVLYPRSCY